jgi:hypothetical protein
MLPLVLAPAAPPDPSYLDSISDEPSFESDLRGEDALRNLQIALQSHELQELGGERSCSFPDQDISPLELAWARYGVDLSGNPAEKRARTEGNMQNTTGLLGYGFFNKEPWGEADHWSRLSLAFEFPSKIMDVFSVTPPSFIARIGHSLQVSIIPPSGSLPFCYVIRSTGYSAGHALILSSALDVMQIFRCGWDHLTFDELAQQLSRRLIPFTCAVEGPSPLIRVLPKSGASGLGYRPDGYVATDDDFHSWQSQAQHLLAGPRGQLAIQEGGLIARMAVEVTEFKVSSLMPELSALPYCISLGSKTYWYDQLSDAERAILCGVYFFYTGTFIF